MIRWLCYILSFVLIGLSFSWLTEHTGSIVIHWLDYRIHTSTTFALLTIVTLIASICFFAQCITWFLSIPKRHRNKKLLSHYNKGLLLITEGFSAISSGDYQLAQQCSKKAMSYLGAQPITLLLAAQTAQASGEDRKALTYYNDLMDHKETKMVALKGLLLQARQEGDLEKAIFLAEKALHLKSDARWAISVLFELYKRTGKWQSALMLIPQLTKHKLLNGKTAKHMTGMISLAYGQYLYQQGHLEEAIEKSELAYQRLEGFIPAITTYCQHLCEQGNYRKAEKILKLSWQRQPHPDLLAAYVTAISDEPLDKKLHKIEAITSLNENRADSHAYHAQIAMLTGDYVKAREQARASLFLQENKLACQLLGELERIETNSQSAIQSWLRRAESAPSFGQWHCQSCQDVSKEWHCNCPHCGAFDALTYQTSSAHTQTNVKLSS